MGLRSEDQRRGVCTLSRAGSNVTVRSNSTYTIYLRANGLSYIPAGDVYLHLEYFDNVSADVPVTPCQYHKSHHLSCMRSISADIQWAVIQGHAGLKWSIPGSNTREYTSYISFTCNTSCAGRQKRYSEWLLRCTYTDGFNSSLILPDFCSLKVKSTLRSIDFMNVVYPRKKKQEEPNVNDVIRKLISVNRRNYLASTRSLQELLPDADDQSP